MNVLLASYGTPSYEGYAFVLFERDGKLYEVNGSHCSCYGLEGQWEPEETNVEALLHRLDKGELGASSYDENPFAAEFKKKTGFCLPRTENNRFLPSGDRSSGLGNPDGTI